MSGLLLFTVFAANCLSRAAALICALRLSVWILAHCARAVSLLACGMLVAVGAFHLIPEALEAGVSTAASSVTLVAAGAVFALVDVLLDRFVGHTHSVNRVHAVPALLGGGFEVRTQVCTDRPARRFRFLSAHRVTTLSTGFWWQRPLHPAWGLALPLRSRFSCMRYRNLLVKRRFLRGSA